MKPLLAVLALTLLAVGSPAHAAAPAPAPAARLTLPAPRLESAMSVEKALHDRRSLRAPAPTALTLAELGQLCWAAQGITDDKGHRTAPSAMAAYPLALYVMAGAVEGLEPGFYRYVPAGHALELVARGDRRAEVVEKGIGQKWIPGAPAVFAITGAIDRMGRARDRGTPYMWVEAGLAAQGFFLQATALGLGSTYVGGFDPAKTHAALGLPAGEEVLAILPVGHRP